MDSKIILITHEFSPYRGGVATYCEEVARAAVKRGYSIEVWTQGSAEGDDRFPFQVRRFPGAGNLRPLSLGLFLISLYAETEVLKAARVYLPSRGAQWVYMNLYRVLGWNPGKEILVTFHGTEILRYARNTWLRQTADHFFTQSVHRLTTASAYSVELLREKGFNAWTTGIGIASCALRSDFLERYPSVQIEAERPGLSSDLRVLTLARVHPRKGQLDVARALGALPESLRHKVIYQIAGKGDKRYLNQVENQCRSSGVRVELLGEIAEEKIGEVYRDSDLYVMTSRSLPESIEGFGMTYLEAGFWRKPVIGYRTGGVAEAVIDQKTGILVCEGDHEGLTGAIQKILENPKLAREMGVAGREHALSYSWETTVTTLFGPRKNSKNDDSI